VFALAFLLVLVVGASYELRAWLRETDARQRTTIAVCGNWDTLYVHDAHWNQAARTTRVRKIPAPPCDTLSETP